MKLPSIDATLFPIGKGDESPPFEYPMIRMAFFVNVREGDVE